MNAFEVYHNSTVVETTVSEHADIGSLPKEAISDVGGSPTEEPALSDQTLQMNVLLTRVSCVPRILQRTATHLIYQFYQINQTHMIDRASLPVPVPWVCGRVSFLGCSSFSNITSERIGGD